MYHPHNKSKRWTPPVTITQTLVDEGWIYDHNGNKWLHPSLGVKVPHKEALAIQDVIDNGKTKQMLLRIGAV